MARALAAFFWRGGGLFLALCALAMSFVVAPNAQAQSSAGSVAGTVWFGTYQYEGEGVVQFEGLTFNRDGTVDGMPLMRGGWVQRGNRVTMDHGSSVPDFVMIGTINGDRMTGTFSHGSFRGTFSVQRGGGQRSAPPAAANPGGSVAGTSWQGQYTNVGEPPTQFESLTFNPDGTVTGYPLMAGNWTQRGNRVTMDHGTSVPDFVMEGVVNGNTMTGTFSYLGGEYRGTFSVRLAGPVDAGVDRSQDTFWRGRFSDMDYAMILHGDGTLSLAYGGDMATGAWYDDSSWLQNGGRIEFRLYSNEPYGYVGTIRGNAFTGTWSQGQFSFQRDAAGFAPPPMRAEMMGQTPSRPRSGK
jgi:hypothetical protein